MGTFKIFIRKITQRVKLFLLRVTFSVLCCAAFLARILSALTTGKQLEFVLYCNFLSSPQHKIQGPLRKTKKLNIMTCLKYKELVFRKP